MPREGALPGPAQSSCPYSVDCCPSQALHVAVLRGHREAIQLLVREANYVAVRSETSQAALQAVLHMQPASLLPALMFHEACSAGTPCWRINRGAASSGPQEGS